MTVDYRIIHGFTVAKDFRPSVPTRVGTLGRKSLARFTDALHLNTRMENARQARRPCFADDNLITREINLLNRAARLRPAIH